MPVISLRHITSIKEENTVFKQIRFELSGSYTIGPYLIIFSAILRNLIFCRHFLIFRTFYRHFFLRFFYSHDIWRSNNLPTFDGIFKFAQTIIYLHYIQTLNMPTEVQVLPTNIKLGGGGSSPPLDPPFATPLGAVGDVVPLNWVKLDYWNATFR